MTETACGASAASGQEGERLNVWQEDDIPEIFFPEGHISDGNPCFRSERK